MTIHDAKTTLSRLIQKACSGEEVIIARGAQPVARLVGIAGGKSRRVPSSLKGQLFVGEEFFEPLPESELAGWEK